MQGDHSANRQKDKAKPIGWPKVLFRCANLHVNVLSHIGVRDVCFLDTSNGFKFVTRSCANAKEMVKMEDGRDLPLFKLDTSSESHPFYTGTQKSVDNMGGRVERFRNRFGKSKTAEAATPAAAE